MADHELRNVGDPALGQWRELGQIAVHLRRRLTPLEEVKAGNLQVLDIRGTDEHTRRIDRMRLYLPLSLRQQPALEFP